MVERREANAKKKKTKHLNMEERKFQDDQGTQVHTKKNHQCGQTARET
jgi:hypothetical protein